MKLSQGGRPPGNHGKVKGGGGVAKVREKQMSVKMLK